MIEKGEQKDVRLDLIFGFFQFIVYDDCRCWSLTFFFFHIADFKGQFDLHKDNNIGVVVETKCNYFSSVAFPDVLICGLSVSTLSKSSVRYEIGIFKNKNEPACAQGIHQLLFRQGALSLW
jgi:hypothetical protein